jgi:hypothetical protein
MDGELEQMDKQPITDITCLRDCMIVRPDIECSQLIQLIRAKQIGSGTIIAVGPTAQHVKVGHKIFFGDFVGQAFRWNNEDLLVMRQEHIHGVFENE